MFMFSGVTFGADSISEEVAWFSPLWFPQGKLFVSLVSCVLLMCMLFSHLKILSHNDSLNDKNITIWRCVDEEH